MQTKSIILSLILCFWAFILPAQTPEFLYLDRIQEEFYSIMESYMDYNAKIVHSDNKRGVEQKRQALVAQIRTSKSKIMQTNAIKGGENLKKSAVVLCDKLISQFDGAHRKALSMRENGDGSYEEMEKFINYLESIQKESDKAWEAVDTVFEAFALANGIKLVEDNSKFAKTLQQVGEMNSYQHKIFLILFRSSRPNLLYWAAIKHKNPETASYALQELKGSLEFSMKEINDIGPFRTDDTYRQAVLKLMNYIKTSSEKDYPALIEYYISAYKSEETTKKMEKFMETYNNTYQKHYDNMENVGERFTKKYTPKTPVKRSN